MTAAGEPSVSTRHARRGVTVAAWSVTAVLALAIAVILAMGAMKPPRQLRKPRVKLANVEVYTVRREAFEQALVLPAKVLADHEVAVGSELAGTLKAWLAPEGAAVEAGQVVAQLDTRSDDARLAELAAQLRSAHAAVAVAAEEARLEDLALTQAARDVTARELGVRGARADHDLAEKEFTRIQALAAGEIGTAVEFDAASNTRVQAQVGLARATEALGKARTAVQAAEVRVARAKAAKKLSEARSAEIEAAMASVRVNLAKASLRAPIAGRLDEHLVEVGETLRSGTVAARIYDLDHIRVRVDVADRYAPFLDADSKAVDRFVAMTMPGARRAVRAKLILPGLPKLTGSTYAGLELDAEVVFIGQAADEASNTFKVELRLANPGHALKQGIICQARITYLVYPEALVVPLRAIQVSDRGPRVMVARPGDGGTVAEVRDIEPVSIKEDRVLVHRGLAAGDWLVVAGGKGLVDGERIEIVMRDGQPVSVAPAPSGEPPALFPTPGRP